MNNALQMLGPTHSGTNKNVLDLSFPFGEVKVSEHLLSYIPQCHQIKQKKEKYLSLIS